jgi:hypothetical protein
MMNVISSEIYKIFRSKIFYVVSFGSLNLLSDTIVSKFGEVDLFEFIRMNVGMISMFLAMCGIGTFFSYPFKNGGIAIATVLVSTLLFSERDVE